MKITLNIILFILLISCKENRAESSVGKSKEVIIKNYLDSINYSNQSLDSILLCDKYSYMSGYFTIPYNGCNYIPNTNNKIGDVEVYLIPNKKIDMNDIDKEENKLNALSIEQIKSNYKIYLFIIDKSFISYHANREVTYYANLPYKQTVYTYTNTWEKIETLNITEENDSIYKEIKTKLLSADLIKQMSNLKGSFRIKTLVEAIETGDTIEMNFYFQFDSSSAILSIGSNAPEEAYCEGDYKLSIDGDIIMLEYVGDGSCTTGGENIFLIKYEESKFLIRSKRFLKNEWQVLVKD